MRLSHGPLPGLDRDDPPLTVVIQAGRACASSIDVTHRANDGINVVPVGFKDSQQSHCAPDGLSKPRSKSCRDSYSSCMIQNHSDHRTYLRLCILLA